MEGSLLWVYEGQTQFWGYVLGARSGMLSKQDTLDAIAATAATYSTGTPGRTWRALVDTTNDPIIANRAAQPWRSWQRSEDYYSEGQLIWIDVDRIIRQQSGGKRSIDDFAKAFFGVRDRDWGELTYTFDDIVATLNRVQPYDWRGYLQRRVYAIAASPPLEGIEQGGYRLVYTAEPTKWIKSAERAGKNNDLTYSGGFTVGNDGKVAGVLWDSAAFNAGLTVGSTISAVNGRDFDGDALKEAIRAAATGGPSPQLLVHDGDVYRTVTLDWRGGLRYPHLAKGRYWRGNARRAARSALIGRQRGVWNAFTERRRAGGSCAWFGSRRANAPARRGQCPFGARADRSHQPELHAVIAVDPTAITQARRIDSGSLRGPLAGQPVLIKDNIEAAGPLPTTAGSLALANNVTNRDAPLVARLRASGAVIVGKTNLSEWANIRSTHSISGWSAVGGQTRNPWALNRNACGSSSGSGAAVAAGLVRLAIGTETDGSITCPASINGIVGLKPTVGLVSRTHIVPISHSQDTAGPMAASVREAAELLSAIAGSDPGDPATAGADKHKRDYAAGLGAASLKGKRIGVMRFASGFGTDAGVRDCALAASPAGRRSSSTSRSSTTRPSARTKMPCS